MVDAHFSHIGASNSFDKSIKLQLQAQTQLVVTRFKNGVESSGQIPITNHPLAARHAISGNKFKTNSLRELQILKWPWYSFEC